MLPYGYTIDSVLELSEGYIKSRNSADLIMPGPVVSYLLEIPSDVTRMTPDHASEIEKIFGEWEDSGGASEDVDYDSDAYWSEGGDYEEDDPDAEPDPEDI